MRVWFVFFLVLVQRCVAKKLDVLFVVVDDLRPALGSYGDGNAKTPNIDRLAAKSFVFTNAFAQVTGILCLIYTIFILKGTSSEDGGGNEIIHKTFYYFLIGFSIMTVLKSFLLLYGIKKQALCAPSRNSLLTSRRPDSLHLYDFYSYWRTTVGNFTTLPQLFKENGYFTQSIGKIFHPGVSSNFTDDSPYSWSGKPFHPKTEIYKEAKVCLNSDGQLARNLVCPVIVDAQPGGTLPDLESLVAGLEFLDNREKITDGRPFFLAVGFHKPHVPLKFPVEYLDYHPIEKVILPPYRLRPPFMPPVAWNPWFDVKNREDISSLNISFPFGQMPDNVTRKIIQSYNAAMTYIDDLIGSLLSKINLDSTIVVLTSDHGWSRGEHGEFSKFSNFDVATQVPLIIHVPRLSNIEVIVDDLVELVDIFPTLVDLTQVAPALQTCRRDGANSTLCTEGKSLMPIMYARARKLVARGKRAVFSQYPRPGAYPSSDPDSDRPKLKDINIMGYSIRTSRYRYTEWVKFNHTTLKPDWSKIYGRELYDHFIDPLENMNLESRPELNFVLDSLHKQLKLGWRYA